MALLQKTPPTYVNLLRAMEDALRSEEIDGARRTAEWLLLAVVGGSRAELYAHGDRTVSKTELAELEQMVERRCQSEPLQYVIGHTEFYGLRIEVTPAVLIPRPETERVVDRLLARLEGVEEPAVLDIGTGSGCIALAVAHERPDANVTACDRSEAALEVARENARKLDLAIAFVRADVEAEKFLADRIEAFDAVVSNPPYVSLDERESLEPEVRAYEPGEALFTPDDPLHFYRLIAAKSSNLLRNGGWLVFETHADHGSEVADMLRSYGYGSVELYDDWMGRPRVALGIKPDGD